MSRLVQGIEKQLTVEPGLRSPAVGWSPATVDWLLWRGKVRFLARGASPRHARSTLRVRRGWERLCWPVYGGRGSGGRGHAVRGATPVIWCSGEVERERGSTVEVPGGFIGVSNDAGLAWRDAGHAGAGVGRALASSERVEHVDLCFCSSSTPCWAAKRVNLALRPLRDLFPAPRAT
jgi:hypothetical protein